ncbi:unnamed protein product [Cladocopium goreaui]|uniref:Uncharacterized protein n=1 Tax=Cladocopium goreaui TaxID=2562237 RepID=A0A9P1G125_9DINO|nr:unnamed protein product [Cladocopium goreaui]
MLNAGSTRFHSRVFDSLLPGMVHGLDQVAAHRIPIVSRNKMEQRSLEQISCGSLWQSFKMLESLSDLSGVRKLTSIEDVRSVLLVILENPKGSDPQSDKNYHKQYRRIRTIQLFHAWFVDVCCQTQLPAL